MSLCRVPLRKQESIRDTMKEKGLLGELLRTPKHNPMQKYHFGDLGEVYEPLDFLDVSPDPLAGGSLSLLAKSKARLWGCAVLSPLHPPSSPRGLPDWTEGLCVLGQYGS